jgi:hypothetical protein
VACMLLNLVLGELLLLDVIAGSRRGQTEGEN